MGIRPARSGAIAYLLGSLMAAVSGVLIAPVNTIFYDSGFLIGLKAFVGAIIGGLVELSRRRDRRALRRHARKLRRFPEQRLQGRHRVFPADSRPALALDRLRPLRRRHRGMSAWPSKLAAVLAVVAILAAPTFVSAFTVTLLNYIGVYALVAIGLVLLTGIGGLVSFGQAAFVALGAYSTAWLTTTAGQSPWLGLVLAIAVTCARRGRPRLRDLAPEGTLPVVEHDRLGARDRVLFRQHRRARQLQRHRVDSRRSPSGR